jgi:hypothetical protein
MFHLKAAQSHGASRKGWVSRRKAESERKKAEETGEANKKGAAPRRGGARSKGERTGGLLALVDRRSRLADVYHGSAAEHDLDVAAIDARFVLLV